MTGVVVLVEQFDAAAPSHEVRELLDLARDVAGHVGGGVTLVHGTGAGDPGTPGGHLDESSTAELVAEEVGSLRPRVVLARDTRRLRSIAPAVAARLAQGFARGVTSIGWDGALVATSRAIGGNAEATLRFPGKESVFLLTRPGRPLRGSDDWQPEVRRLPAAPGRRAVEQRRQKAAPAASGREPVVLAAGGGVTEEAWELLQQLADTVGASVSVSRPLVENGWADPSQLVGVSGRSTRPSVYVAFGISGAYEHAAGMREADTIVAVNHDPSAPIFGVADYAVVADAARTLEELLSELA